MIIALDRIAVHARDRARLEQRIQTDYLPGAARRGLVFVDAWTSPPFELLDEPITLFVRWRVADIPSWWAMRSASGDPAVAAFWASVDPIIVSRERRYLVEEPLGAGAVGSPPRAPEASWPAPIDTEPHRVATRGWRETVQLHLPTNATDGDVTAVEETLAAAGRALPGIEGAWIAANLVADYGAGHLTWDLRFPDRATAEKARQSAAWREGVAPVLTRHCSSWTALGLETVGAGIARPGLKEGIKRTALFRALPGVARSKLDRWERDLLEMPAHVTSIVNWRLSRAIPLAWSNSNVPAWTHVWEQEYEKLEGLSVDYMVHPHHWAHVDRWFDPESGDQIIDTALCHAYSPMAGAVISGDAG
ncbi:MAG: Dabb family protein [Deltaproteobacteria bacterium]|nr:Dabb family protein [Deltaproteobacteria bacterium]